MAEAAPAAPAVAPTPQQAPEKKSGPVSFKKKFEFAN